jgi:hypothetical protein
MYSTTKIKLLKSTKTQMEGRKRQETHIEFKSVSDHKIKKNWKQKLVKYQKKLCICEKNLFIVTIRSILIYKAIF